jgi:hypothetical protein
VGLFGYMSLGSTDGRFELLHARAIGWPEDRFEYLGIDDDGDTTQHYAGEVSPSLLTGSILTRAAQIRFHTLPILSIRLSPTTIYKETIPKPIFSLSPLSYFQPRAGGLIRMVSITQGGRG